SLVVAIVAAVVAIAGIIAVYTNRIGWLDPARGAKDLNPVLLKQRRRRVWAAIVLSVAVALVFGAIVLDDGITVGMLRLMMLVAGAAVIMALSILFYGTSL